MDASPSISDTVDSLAVIMDMAAADADNGEAIDISDDCCNKIVCEFASEWVSEVGCWAQAGSSVNRSAISKSRSTSVSLDSIKLKRLQNWRRERAFAIISQRHIA